MRTERRTLANLVAPVLAVVASLLLLVMPVYRSVRSSTVVVGGEDAPTSVTTVSDATLLQQSGPGVLVILGIPVLITLMPFVVRRATRRLAWRLGPAILLTVFCILTGFSIGLFYMPAAVALWIAEILPPGEPRSPLDR